jgi:hypothetical protein
MSCRPKNHGQNDDLGACFFIQALPSATISASFHRDDIRIVRNVKIIGHIQRSRRNAGIERRGA